MYVCVYFSRKPTIFKFYAWLQFSATKSHGSILKPESPGRGLTVVAPACMHGFANFRKFKTPVTLTLTLDPVKVISACTVPVVLPARPTI